MHERLRQLEAGAGRPGLGSVILRRGCRLAQKLDRFGVFAELDQCASLVIGVRGLVQFRRSFDALARRPCLRCRRLDLSNVVENCRAFDEQRRIADCVAPTVAVEQVEQRLVVRQRVSPPAGTDIHVAKVVQRRGI